MARPAVTGTVGAAAAAVALLLGPACLAPGNDTGAPEAAPRTMPALPPPRTVPELTGYARTCSHAELLDFLDAVGRRGDPRIVRTRFGATPEGRELPLLIVADPPVADAAAARADGRTRVLVMANIHAGEVEGKEACLELLRDIAWGRGERSAAAAPESRGGAEPYPVRDLLLLLAPIYNADGNDRFGPKNRPLQQGPVQAGQRADAAGLDLNRDYLKVEAAETSALVALLDAWDPHVVVDLHTTNGSAHGYELTYAPTLSPSAHPALRDLLERDWLPALRRRVRERSGFELFDYGNFTTPAGDEQDEPDAVTGWRTFDHRPRFGNNYVGLRNRVAILSEAYAYADFATRIAATKAFVTEILRLAAERGGELPAFCRRLDEETAQQGGEGELVQATGAELFSRGIEPVLLRGFEERIEPATGETVRVAAGERRSVDLPIYAGFAATAARAAPRAYLLLPGQAAIAAHCRRHGLRVDTLEAAVEVRVDVHTLRETSVEAEPFQGHHQRHAVFDVAAATRAFPAGSFRVPLDQPLARLAFQLLDPEADDGLLVWNFWDAALERGPGSELPVYPQR